MDEFATIQDYSMIDAFINKSLEDFNKKLFGNYDPKTGYFEEASNEDDEKTETVDDIEQNENTQEDRVLSDEEMYNHVFDEDFDNQSRQYADPNEQYDAISQPTENISFKQGVLAEGLSYRATNIINDLSNVAGKFVITSGKRNGAENSKLKGSSKNSFHLTGDAVDIRPTESLNAFLSSLEGKKFMQNKGYEIIDERNVSGVGPHWHLEPVKKQAGGTPIAKTKQQQYTGLNDQALDNLFMPLKGQNTIRGLDSGEPVYVQDEHGNEAILYGPQDTIYMTGDVYEKKISKKYKTK